MGLDITAYNKANLLPKHAYDGDSCYDAGHCFVFVEDGFERSYRGLADPDTRFSFPGSTSDVGGGRCYDVSDSETHRFQAGSYSGYGKFRDLLAQAFHHVDAFQIWPEADRYADAPFFELINFSDCEGTIGPDAAADLLKDFEDGRSQWADYLVAKYGHRVMDQKYYLEKYEDWAHACRLAADRGLIDFH